MGQGKPPVRHAVGFQPIQLGHAQLQGIETEHIDHSLRKVFALPGQQVLPLRREPPFIETYNFICHKALGLLRVGNTCVAKPALSGEFWARLHTFPVCIHGQRLLHTPMVLFPVPAFSDNYIWVLHDEHNAMVVDPGASEGVLAYLQGLNLRLETILVTHHHADHTGAAEFLSQSTGAQLVAPAHEWLGPAAQRVGQGSQLEALGLAWTVLDVPGHTQGHVAYWADGVPLATSPNAPATVAPVLFCGDTLFSAGCGRLFEGTPADMLDSLDRLNLLPADTRVCCTHEYTLGNLRFARAVEPDNQLLQDWDEHCQKLRQALRPTLPSTLELERQINPFLRVRQPDVRRAAALRTPTAQTDVQVLAAIRQWKNEFQ